MVGRTIIRGNKNYFGRFVATASFNNNVVVASGKDPEKVRSLAVKRGHEKPVIVYIPPKGTLNLY